MSFESSKKTEEPKDYRNECLKFVEDFHQAKTVLDKNRIGKYLDTEKVKVAIEEIQRWYGSAIQFLIQNQENKKEIENFWGRIKGTIKNDQELDEIKQIVTSQVALYSIFSQINPKIQFKAISELELKIGELEKVKASKNYFKKIPEVAYNDQLILNKMTKPDVELPHLILKENGGTYFLDVMPVHSGKKYFIEQKAIPKDTYYFSVKIDKSVFDQESGELKIPNIVLKKIINQIEENL